MKPILHPMLLKVVIYTLKLNSLELIEGFGKEEGRVEEVCLSAPWLTWKYLEVKPLILQRGRLLLQVGGCTSDCSVAWPNTDKQLCCQTRADLFLWGVVYLCTSQDFFSISHNFLCHMILCCFIFWKKHIAVELWNCGRAIVYYHRLSYSANYWKTSIWGLGRLMSSW